MEFKVFYNYSSILKFRIKEQITIDLDENAHILLTGGTGSGKTYALFQILGKISKDGNVGMLVGDFKRGKDFKYLSSKLGKGYYDYSNYHELIDYTYDLLEQRKGMTDKELENVLRIVVVLEEWASFILNMDKKQAEEYKKKLGVILMLGREFKINIITVLQRPDTSYFTNGARDNYGVRIGMGVLSSEGRKMMFPDVDKEQFKGLQGIRGEGAIHREGQELQLLKVPKINSESMQRIRDNIEYSLVKANLYREN